MKPLVPPDRTQCQADKPNGHSFMTLGGTLGGRVRCTNKSKVVITENKPAADGRRGSMALCTGCLQVFQRHFGEGYATVAPISAARMKRASYREGIEIIALNDEPEELDEEFMVGMASVMLLAGLFGLEQERVAKDVVRYRKTHARKTHAKAAKTTA